MESIAHSSSSSGMTAARCHQICLPPPPVPRIYADVHLAYINVHAQAWSFPWRAEEKTKGSHFCQATFFSIFPSHCHHIHQSLHLGIMTDGLSLLPLVFDLLPFLYPLFPIRRSTPDGGVRSVELYHLIFCSFLLFVCRCDAM